MIMSVRSLVVSAGLVAVFSSEGGAQIRASERASVTQTIDGTTITIDYARPRMRGRAEVFGDEVKWEEVWTPGANMATTLEVSKDIQVNGHAVPKGKYSVWMVVHKGDWTLVLDSTANRFHTDRPDPSKAVVRFDVQPQRRPKVEVLTWSFPEIRSDGGMLAMQWETYYVPLTVKVPSSYSMTVASEVASPMVGRYEMRWVPPPVDTSAAAVVDTSAPADSAPQAEGHEPEGPGGPITIDLTYGRGSLWGHVDPAPFPGYDTFVLLRVKDDWYIPAWWKNGELYDASDDMLMEFKFENGKVTGFDVRSKDDTVIATASRIR
jgi:hypothetical protein